MPKGPNLSTAKLNLERLAGSDEQLRQEAAQWFESLPQGHLEDHPIPHKHLMASRDNLGVALRTSKSNSVRVWCAQMLANLRGKACDQLPMLIELLSDNSPDVVVASIWAIGNMQRHAIKAVPALLSQLQNRQRDIRWRVHWALAEIAPRGCEVEHFLARSFDDDDPLVRGYAVLGFIGIADRSEWAREQLLRVADDNDAMPREHARNALRDWPKS